MTLPQLSSVSVTNARVLVRVGFDVPTDTRGHVLDAFRLRRGIPTLRLLRRRGAKTILLGHRGEPHGKRENALSFRPVAHALTSLLHAPVTFVSQPPKTLARMSQQLRSGDIVLLENLRFDIREEKCSEQFARELARLGDLFVNDDFSTSHRAHSSIAALPQLLPHVAGLNLAEEVLMLTRLLHKARKPFVVILGGAKVHDKLGVVRNLLPRVTAICVGGAAASTLLHARGYAVGRSLVDVEPNSAEAKRLLRSKKIVLPVDFVVARRPSAQKVRVIPADSVPTTDAVYDIGPVTAARYGALLRTARTIFGQGPLA